MGGNGSHISGILNTEEGRAYKTLFKISNNIVVLEQKSPKQKGKLPEESHTPNRVYATFLGTATISRKSPSMIKMVSKSGQSTRATIKGYNLTIILGAMGNRRKRDFLLLKECCHY